MPMKHVDHITLKFSIGFTRHDSCSVELGEQIVWAMYDEIKDKFSEHGEIVNITVKNRHDQTMEVYDITHKD